MISQQYQLVYLNFPFILSADAYHIYSHASVGPCKSLQAFTFSYFYLLVFTFLLLFFEIILTYIYI